MERKRKDAPKTERGDLDLDRTAVLLSEEGRAASITLTEIKISRNPSVRGVRAKNKHQKGKKKRSFGQLMLDFLDFRPAPKRPEYETRRDKEAMRGR